MSNKIKNFIIILSCICFVIVFVYNAWNWTRDINYSLSYEEKVIKTTNETICKSIKPEYLTIKCD